MRAAHAEHVAAAITQPARRSGSPQAELHVQLHRNPKVTADLQALAARQLLTDAGECLGLACNQIAVLDFGLGLDLAAGGARRLDEARALLRALFGNEAT